jgi:hypothetical protein
VAHGGGIDGRDTGIVDDHDVDLTPDAVGCGTRGAGQQAPGEPEQRSAVKPEAALSVSYP